VSTNAATLIQVGGTIEKKKNIYEKTRVPTNDNGGGGTLCSPQRAWRRRRRFDDAVRTSGPPAADGRSSRERLADEPTDDGRECGDDESDDAERVNVVGKGHGDYVPPVPDFVRGTYSSAAERSSGSKYGGEDDDSSERLV